MSLGCVGALGILQSIVHGSPLAERTLFLTTSGTQAISADSDRPLDALNASLWGFGRVVRKLMAGAELPAHRSQRRHNR